MDSPFPKLPVLDPSTPHAFVRPAKRIVEGSDVPHFLTSQGYRDIGLFVLQLNRALCPRKIEQEQEEEEEEEQQQQQPPRIPRLSALSGPPAQTFALDSPRNDPPSVLKLRALLDKLDAVIDEVPPDPGPRRFGNVSFRTWHNRVEERVDGLLREHLDPKVLRGSGHGQNDSNGDDAALEVTAYFLGGFGSSQRLDYGTGHELSFFAFLGCLWKLGAFDDGDTADGSIERSIVLGVFERYLQVVRRLILTYTLEPAGTHGVWGLDDHSIMPYIFGSAQLARPIAPSEPMPTEGSVRGAPKPADVVKAASVDRLRTANMYFSAIGFINDVKRGPFWEHSPMLFDISGIRDGWGKINKGMVKMFNAEVLSKFPVVQHFPFGSLFSWDPDPHAAAPVQSVHMANQPIAAAATAAAGIPSSSGPSAPAGIPYSRAPWASAGSGAQATPPRNQPGMAPPPSCPAGRRGTTSAQHTVTKAPWARD